MGSAVSQLLPDSGVGCFARRLVGEDPDIGSLPMLYVEKKAEDGGHSELSTDDALSRVSTARSIAKAINVVKAPGYGFAIPERKLDKDRLSDFTEMLHEEGINTASWGCDGSKSVAHLFWELYVLRGALLIRGPDGRMTRITRLVKIKLLVDIYGVEHALFSRLQFTHDGQSVERKQVPLQKLQWVPESELPQEVKEGDLSILLAANCPYTEDWRAGCRKVLQARLGLSEKWQEQHLEEDLRACSYHHEDDVSNSGYPGLKTVYCIHQATFRIAYPETPAASVIGLPCGREFATSEGDFHLNSLTSTDLEGLPIGSQLNIWTWAREVHGTQSNKKVNIDTKKSIVVVTQKEPLPERLPHGPSCRTAGCGAAKGEEPRPDKVEHGQSAPTATPSIVGLSRLNRVPLGQTVRRLQLGEEFEVNQGVSHEPPNSALVAAMQDKKVDWDRIRGISRRILDPDYSLHDYMKDISCFPELDLYLIEDIMTGDGDSTPSDAAVVNRTLSGSGRTVGDEYQRTIGAFFAIYWLLRLRLDGKHGFSFGVGEDWRPVIVSEDGHRQGTGQQMKSSDRRYKFFKDNHWDKCEELLIDAGLIRIVQDDEAKDGPPKERLEVVEERLTTLLALTAIHDIMKMEPILPTVQPEHAPYHGYEAGNVIGDHDQALSYVMDYFPEVLPSFAGLTPEQRSPVQFTQCQLCFNHGWFVQAEAPPGAIFTKFREALIRGQKAHRPLDIALYFVHWLTDLAGAEPTPLAGCEKFVIKFPLPVLSTFLRSFATVQKIASQTEAGVVEDYLKVRWLENNISLGPLPTGPAAIAKMRVACMAQGNAGAFLDAWDELDEDSCEILSVEMSRTGCIGQQFSHNLVPREVHSHLEGPALLLYYAPAFLQNLGSDCPVGRLQILAEVFRAARELWPLSIAKAGTTVIVRIDTIKGLDLTQIQAGHLWILVKHNESEAFIEKSSKRKLNSFIARNQALRVLDFDAVC